MTASAVRSITRAWVLSGTVAMALAPLAAAEETSRPETGPGGWTLACSPENDLYRVLAASGLPCPRFATADEAVRAAPAGSGVLALADGYPDQPTAIAPAAFDEAARKRLRLYVEYPERLPDMELGAPKDVKYERGVVSSEIFGESLRPLRIVLVSSCRYLPVKASESHLVVAKVAGVDTAVFGLKDTAAEPLLFDHPRGNLLVATTKLSHFVSGRYLPTEAWRTDLGDDPGPAPSGRRTRQVEVDAHRAAQLRPGGTAPRGR